MSRIYVTRDPEAAPESLVSKAPPARIGLATFGLGNRGEAEEIQLVTRLRGLIVGLARQASDVADRLGEAWSGRLVAALLMAIMRAGDEAGDAMENGRALRVGRR